MGNGATPEVGPCAWVRVTLGQVDGCGVGVGVGLGLGLGLGLPLGGPPEAVFIEVTPPQATSIVVASTAASSPVA